MHLKAGEELKTGDLVCLRETDNNGPLLVRWRMGDNAIGVTARALKPGETVDYSPEQSTDDILVRGSHAPMSGQKIVMQAVCDLKADELVCIRHTGGQAMIDRWGYGDEAVGMAARDIKANEFVTFSAGKSTDDIQVKPIPQNKNAPA